MSKQERDRGWDPGPEAQSRPKGTPFGGGGPPAGTLPAPGAPGEGTRVQARLPAATHPQSPGSIPGAGYTADAHFLIKGLAYGVKTPLPSPTLAPTLVGSVSCQLPAPWVHSQAPARTAGGGLDQQQGSEAGQAQLLSQQAVPSLLRDHRPLSDVTETVIDKGTHYFHFHCSVISAAT